MPQRAVDPAGDVLCTPRFHPGADAPFEGCDDLAGDASVDDSASLFVAAAFGNRHLVIETGFEGVAGYFVEGGSRFRTPLGIGQNIAKC